MIEKYYEEELRYLYESGKEFARAHPDRARFLNIDAVGDRDPYVERLFEGFAFLAARIREKIDDSFPELTEGLMGLLWPQLLEEVPSLAVVEFKPRRGFLQSTRIIERGAEILSPPAGSESAICRFSTTQDVTIGPYALKNIERKVDTRGKASLDFHFILEPGVQWDSLGVSSIQFFLYAELPTALMLHEFLTRRVLRASISLQNGTQTTTLDPEKAVTPGGLTPSESLLPRESRNFWGYALLREYFIFPDKFLFVNLNGFDAIPLPEENPSSFTYSLTFNDDFVPDKPFGAENFRLFCSPIANIFKKDAEPVYWSGHEPECRVVADSSYPGSFHTHSVVSITGVDRTTGERIVYNPFHSFKHIGDRTGKTYTVQYRYGPDAQRQCFVALGGERLVDDELHEETLSIEAWLTNGTLPRDELREGDINKPGPGFPDYVMVTNITRPTMPFMPPKEGHYLWTFLSHLGATYSTLASAETLKSFLKLYDWSNSEGRARRIKGISDVQAQSTEMTINGAVVRGIEFSVSLLESEFLDIGDIHLFGQILKEFLAHYVSINSFIELILILKPSSKQLRWNSLKGKQWVI
ncbi:MAG: type VI secretion system baseplate subunit TssF [Chitinivibrionales bacterium]|nr:type VI secretion system baseplate subunit TssF [Chitinivibrionales bacterium]